MRSNDANSISIWWFIGVLLTIYGVLITGVSIYAEATGTAPDTVLHELRPGIWWGLVLFALGAFYTKRFWPWKQSR